MWKTILNALIFTIASLLLEDVVGSAVEIDIETYYAGGVVPNSFNVRCSPVPPALCARSIMSMQVTRGDNTIVASIQGGDSISYSRLLESSVSAAGHIDKNVSETFLSVTINNAVKSDSGSYTCKLFYLNEGLQAQVDTATKNVTIESQDSNDIIKFLMSKIVSLDNKVQYQEKELFSLKSTLSEQGTKIQDYEEQIAQLANETSSKEFNMKRITNKVDGFSYIELGKETFIYALSPNALNYGEAKEHCTVQGATLVDINSVAEFSALSTFFRLKVISSGQFWVGAHDFANEKQWVSDKTGEPIDFSIWKFNPGEPNNSGNEDCAAFVAGDDGLNDVPCDRDYQGICERDYTGE